MNTRSIALGVVMTIVMVGMPLLVSAQELQSTPDAKFLVSCAGPNAETVGGRELPSCNWCSLVQMISNLVQYAIYFAVIVSSLAFAYAGALFLVNNGNPAQVTRALSIFKYVILGLVGVLSAWLIVQAIMTKLAVGLGLGDNWRSITGCEEASGPTPSSWQGSGNPYPGSQYPYPSNEYNQGVIVLPGVGSGSNTSANQNTQATGIVSTRLQNAGVTVSSVNGCVDNRAGCTYVQGLTEETVDFVLDLKSMCGADCAVRITGAAEPGRTNDAYAYSAGYKIDLGVGKAEDADFAAFIETSRIAWEPTKFVPGYGQEYKDGCGNLWLKVGDKWSVTVYASNQNSCF